MFLSVAYKIFIIPHCTLSSYSLSSITWDLSTFPPSLSPFPPPCIFFLSPGPHCSYCQQALDSAFTCLHVGLPAGVCGYPWATGAKCPLGLVRSWHRAICRLKVMTTRQLFSSNAIPVQQIISVSPSLDGKIPRHRDSITEATVLVGRMGDNLPCSCCVY